MSQGSPSGIGSWRHSHSQSSTCQVDIVYSLTCFQPSSKSGQVFCQFASYDKGGCLHNSVVTGQGPRGSVYQHA